jgi:hypothetical protein
VLELEIRWSRQSIVSRSHGNCVVTRSTSTEQAYVAIMFPQVLSTEASCRKFPVTADISAAFLLLRGKRTKKEKRGQK